MNMSLHEDTFENAMLIDDFKTKLLRIQHYTTDM